MKKEEIIKYVNEHATSTILSFPDRGSSWGSSSYRGNFSGWIPHRLLYVMDANPYQRYLQVAAQHRMSGRDLEIPYCGIDLNPNPVRPDISVMDILDYTKDLPDGFYQSDLQILHPPYPGINDIHYSNHMWKGDSRSISADIQEMPWEKGMHARKPSHDAWICSDAKRSISGSRSRRYQTERNLPVYADEFNIAWRTGTGSDKETA